MWPSSSPALAGAGCTVLLLPLPPLLLLYRRAAAAIASGVRDGAGRVLQGGEGQGGAGQARSSPI